MAQEYTVMRAADLPEGGHRLIQVGSREIGLFNIRGEFYALSNICSHQGGPVCTGPVSGTLAGDPEARVRPAWVMEGEVVTCPWHSMEFHIPTGRCLAFPTERVATYKTRVEDGMIKVILAG